MDYLQAIDYLYQSAPMFQNIGAGAYKEGLQTTLAMDAHSEYPHRNYKTIHVAGTNGKGSCSHTLSAILQCAGYKTGLFTSPHLIDFRERIRVNGEPVEKEYVIDFIEKERNFFEPFHPSFFEWATALAFRYFADKKVDVAVIEVGLGGRLDCTNIITPDLSIITNISFDHMQFLGDTIELISAEKAGIIKPHIPVVVGEALPETRPVFTAKANEAEAPIVFAEDNPLLTEASPVPSGGFLYKTIDYYHLQGQLDGYCQPKNTNTLLTALRQLRKSGYRLNEEAVHRGFSEVCNLTGLMGRWQKLHDRPTLVCDTGHNIGGFVYIVEQLKQQNYRKLYIVFGMVSDKDVRAVLSILPKEAEYIFTQARVKRAMSAGKLQEEALACGLKGSVSPTVTQAVEKALSTATSQDFIYVGGSSFVVADLLSSSLFPLH